MESKLILDVKQSDILTDADNGSASSADVTGQETASQADTADADVASPTATDEPTSAEIVAATLAKTRPDAQSEDPDPDAKEAEEDGEAKPDAKAESKDEKDGKSEDKEDRLSDDEMKALSTRARGRINTLTRERHIERERAETAIAQINELQPRAEAFDTIDTALKDSQLSYQDLGDLVTVGAVIRSGDPQKIIEVLTPYWTAAQQEMGNDLTPDYQAKVDASEMTVEAAQEAQRAYLTSQRSQQELEAIRQAEAQRTSEERSRAELSEILADVTNDEFASLTQGRSDLKSIIPLMHEGIKEYVAEHGAVTDPQAARLLVRHVYAKVQAKTAKPAARKATPPSPDPSGPTAAAPAGPLTPAQIVADVLGKTRK